MDRTAVITLSQTKAPTVVVANSEPDSFERDGEAFHRSSDELGYWLGFYDWLRTSDGLIVGVKLRPDSSGILNLFEPFASPSVVIKEGAVTIRTSSQGEVIEVLSDDQDFGGNAVYVGSGGSLAIAFFCPREWS